MPPWRGAILRTRAFERLDALAYDDKVPIPYPDQESQALEPDEETRRHALYLLGWKELWARSYAQYVALRSQEAMLTEQLRAELASDPWTLYHHQWTDEDFVTVAAAMDDLFEAWN